MTVFALWYLALTGLGLAAFPLCFALLPGLADRGYAFSRILGLLVWGYFYWMGGSLGLLPNNFGALVFTFAALAGASAFAAARIDRADLVAWWHRSKGTVFVVEALFLAAFAGWTVIRAMNPEITATEKPMELAFLNAILRSPSFPPNDPWLSGYAISYYYFGFILVGMLAMLTGTTAGVAFNLGIAAVFALAAVGAYGVVANLLARTDERSSGRLLGLFGPLFVLLVSNLAGFLDMLHARGFFWTRNEGGELVSPFWRWVDMKDLVNPPVEPFGWIPERFLWWWRASRVINDTGFTGGQQEVIDEFPFFSFLLADLHPHVLAIPFVLLAVAVAWNEFVRPQDEAVVIFGYDLEIPKTGLLLGGLVMGALAFLNTWDFPIYVALFTGALVLRKAGESGWSWGGIGRAAAAGAAVGALGILLYFPFYAGFSSQAGGILPNLINPTRGTHLWVMFGSLLAPISMYLGGQIVRGGYDVRSGVKWGFGAVAGLWLLSLLLAGVVALVPGALEDALQRLGAPDAGALMMVSFSRRFLSFGGWLTIGALLALAAGFLVRPVGRPDFYFTVLMIAVAGLLIAGPEFVYLRDLFGTRMNTIFKFYYQAWIMLGLAAAFSTARILTRWRGLPALAGAAVVGLVLFAGLTYPVLSLVTKTEGFRSAGGLVLDGTLHGAYLNQDDRAAVAWLQQAELGVLVEAVGGSYSSGGRIAAHSGQPNVLGWVFHQGQWRGGYEEVGSREGDIEKIYTSGSWEETAALLDRYGVTYIYIGVLERSTYPVNTAKFERNLPVLFEQGTVVIHGYSPGGDAP
ncbi:MAG TPA: DUF2298 domain-containing protein [Anaerolineales bacterium]|nr:DUF2298 domain-containing protein [Anaerolineales bacterium]